MSALKLEIPYDLVIVGRVGAAQGIKGWVKIHSETSPSEALFDYRSWQLHLDHSWVAIYPAEWRFHGRGQIARFEHCTNRSEAERYRNLWIAVPKVDLPDTEEDEFYYHELEGMEVITLNREKLGLVNHLFYTGSNHVLVVSPTWDSIDKRERMLPYLSPYIVSVDPQTRHVTVDWDPEF